MEIGYAVSQNLEVMQQINALAEERLVFSGSWPELAHLLRAKCVLFWLLKWEKKMGLKIFRNKSQF